ncbi:hypothetical protein VNO77_27383 [Canavalia gladiata]|uniref:Peptidase C14 caspase domain-containing protein n=1 Tax=Canavalia gladiata TaxID=3824 RepID=A0AAN9QAG3_CANGL
MGGIVSKTRVMSMATKENSKKMALLIGINYRESSQLRGCHNDVEITKHGGMIEAAKEQIGDSTKENRQHSRTSFETIQVPPEDDEYVAYRTAFISTQSNIKAKEDVGPSTSKPPDSGILLSACQSYQKAQEKAFSGTVYGVFTNALVTVIEQTHGIVKNRDLVLLACEMIERQRRVQRPGLYCSDLDADTLYLR